MMNDRILQRLHNQGLLQVSFQTPADVVGWMGAVQSQDYAFAKWALGLRIPNATDATIEQAFNEGALLRTHLLRPTWHFVTPADIRWMLELTAPRVQAFNSSKYRQLELDHALLQRSTARITRALQSRRQLTRDELRDVLEQAGIAAGPLKAGGEHRLSHILMYAELEGVICSGPRRGKQFTYMLLEERAPHARSLSRDEALSQLALRYFQSHGPATLKDFAWWSGLTMADSKTAVEMLRSQLVCDTIDGEIYWFSPESSPIQNGERIAHLVPVWDEYTVAYKERSFLFDTRVAQPDDPGEFFAKHVLLLAGRIVGTWQRTLKKDAVMLHIELLTTLTAAEQRAVDGAVQRYGEYLDLPVIVQK